MFGASDGTVATDHGFFFGDSDQVLVALGSDMMVLQAFGLNPQAKLHGCAAFGINPNAVDTGWGGKANEYLYFTYFWRKLSGKDMTPRERAEEMCAIAAEQVRQQDPARVDALDQVKGLVRRGKPWRRWAA